MAFTRRRILQGSVLGSFAASLPLTTFPALANTLEWVPLADGLALVKGAGSNVLVNWGSDGIAMIDGGHADFASALLATINDHTGGVPELLFNTHCHRDQIGCNPALGMRGATIVAHENTKLWLGTEIISRWEDKVYPPLANIALPNKTFYYDTETLIFNEPVEYGVLPQAHTDGDIYVFFPERNILFAGDVVSPGTYPIIDFSTNGWAGGMIDGLNTLIEKTDASTRIFASTGNEVSKADMESQRDMMMAIVEQIGTNYYSGGTFQEFIDTRPTADFDAQLGDPRLFLYTAYQSVWGHTGEVRRYRRPQ